MSRLTADRIRDLATRLGLTHLTDTITELVVDRAETAQMGYLDFVDLLLEEEVGLRDGRRFRNALKLSGLPHHKPWTSSISPFNRAWTPARSATSPRWSSSRRSPTWLCSARPGSAKPCSPSPSRSAPAKPGCRSTSPLWTTWSPAPRRRSHRPVQPATPSLPPTAVLVVDEVGYLPLDRTKPTCLPTRLPTIRTRHHDHHQQQSFTEWGRVLADNVLATAILDRLLHHCDVININGPSYRLKGRPQPGHRR